MDYENKHASKGNSLSQELTPTELQLIIERKGIKYSSVTGDFISKDYIADDIQYIWNNIVGMPKRFKGVIVLFSVANNFEEAMLEWDVAGIASKNGSNIEFTSQEDRKEERDNCICSHDICNLCFSYNHQTSIMLTIGNCCINKFGSNSMKEQLKRKVNTTKKIKERKRGEQYCLNCASLKISAKYNKLYCLSCVREGYCYPSNIVLSMISTKKCLNCVNQIPNVDRLLVCTQCRTVEDGCFVCGSSNNNGKFRCDDCTDFCLKCSKISCNNVISSDESRQSLCKSCRPVLPDNVRRCQKGNCYNVLNETQPANHKYCSSCFYGKNNFLIKELCGSSQKILQPGDRLCGNAPTCQNIITIANPRYWKVCYSCYRKPK